MRIGLFFLVFGCLPLPQPALAAALPDSLMWALSSPLTEETLPRVRRLLDKEPPESAAPSLALSPLNTLMNAPGPESIRVPVLALLLDRGFRIEASGTGLDPVVSAIREGRTESLKLLLDRDAQRPKDSKDRAALIYELTTERGHRHHPRPLLEELVRVLIERGGDPDVSVNGSTSLHSAITGGRIDLVRALLDAGADPGITSAIGGRNALGWVGATAPFARSILEDLLRMRGAPAQPGFLGLLEQLTRETSAAPPEAPLHRALLAGETVAPADPRLAATAPDFATPAGCPLLHVALALGDATVVESLLARGANVRASSPGGATALHVAAATGNPEMVARVVKAGGNLHAVDDSGRTPLHYACRGGRAIGMPRAPHGLREDWSAAGTVGVLLQAGAKVDVADTRGRTPLFDALESGEGEVNWLWYPSPRYHSRVEQDIRGVLERLLAAGADPRRKDAEGLSPLALAAKWKFRIGVEVLEARSPARGTTKPAASGER